MKRQQKSSIRNFELIQCLAQCKGGKHRNKKDKRSSQKSNRVERNAY